MFPCLPKPVAALAAVLTPLLLASAVSASQGDCGKCLPLSVPSEAAPIAHRDYLVTLGKRPILASQSTQGVRPIVSSANNLSRDYLVTQGKRTALASTLVAPVPSASYSASPCKANRFVAEGKATRWEAGCAMRGTERQMTCCADSK